VFFGLFKVDEWVNTFFTVASLFFTVSILAHSPKPLLPKYLTSKSSLPEKKNLKKYQRTKPVLGPPNQ
jgi:hypothetical protein